MAPSSPVAVPQRIIMERRSLMQIRLLNTDQFYVPSRCATCGAGFNPEAVLALAYSPTGVALGTICDECLHAGRAALAQRTKGYAAELRQHAEALECVADEPLDVLPLQPGLAAIALVSGSRT